MPTSLWLRVRQRTVALTLVSGVFVAGMLPGPALGVTYYVSMYINSKYVSGNGPANTLHNVSLYDPNGQQLETVKAKTGGGGFWSAYFQHPILGGSQIRIAASGYNRTVNIPVFTLRANRTTDIVSGKAPAGRSIGLTLYHYSTLDSTVTSSFSTTSVAGNTWAGDFSSIAEIIGGDTVYAALHVGADTFNLSASAPYVSVTKGSAEFTAYLNWGTRTTVELRTAANALRATGHAAWSVANANQTESFINSGGDPVAVREGDAINADLAADASFTMPVMSVTADAASDVVSGHCKANARYSIYVLHRDYSDSEYRYGTSSASGNLSKDFSATFDLMRNDWITLTCRLPSGDRVVTNGVVP